MGHLDPFFQELNGIGILALIVTVIAVIVRVVFCKTMRARIYTGVLGLISAIVIDSRHCFIFFLVCGDPVL